MFQIQIRCPNSPDLWLRHASYVTPDDGFWPSRAEAEACVARIKQEPDYASDEFRIAVALDIETVPPEITRLLGEEDVFDILEQPDPHAEADARFKACSPHLDGHRRGLELLRAWLSGVDFGEPCGACGAAGLHQDGCPEIG